MPLPRMIDLTPTALPIRPRRVLTALVLVSCGLGATSLFLQYLRFFHGIEWAFGLTQKFDVEEEVSFPTFYSSVLLLAAASVLAVVSRSARLAGDRLATRWLVLAAVFAVLSVDEAVGIHEFAGQQMPEIDALGGILYYAWVLPAAVAVVIAGVYFYPLFRDLADQHRLRFLAAAFVYVGGALGVELVEGAIASRTGDETWPYQLVSTTQEVLEMVGVAVLIWALLKLIESRDPVLRATIHVTDGRPPRLPRDPA